MGKQNVNLGYFNYSQLCLHLQWQSSLSLIWSHHLHQKAITCLKLSLKFAILNREYLALNVYVALCYYKLDYYDVSQVDPKKSIILTESLLIFSGMEASAFFECLIGFIYTITNQEVLAVYLQNFPDSAIAINLKACNHFRWELIWFSTLIIFWHWWPE